MRVRSRRETLRMNRPTRREVLDCASPLALLESVASSSEPSASGGKSGRGLPQSKALSRQTMAHSRDARPKPKGNSPHEPSDAPRGFALRLPSGAFGKRREFERALRIQREKRQRTAAVQSASRQTMVHSRDARPKWEAQRSS